MMSKFWTTQPDTPLVCSDASGDDGWGCCTMGLHIVGTWPWAWRQSVGVRKVGMLFKETVPPALTTMLLAPMLHHQVLCAALDNAGAAFILNRLSSTKCEMTMELLKPLSDSLSHGQFALLAGHAHRQHNAHTDMLSHALTDEIWSQVVAQAKIKKPHKQAGVPFRSFGRAVGGMLPRDDVGAGPSFRAEFKSRCPRCKTVIHKGCLMRKDAKLKKFVHFSCARARQAVVDRDKDASASGRTGQVGRTVGDQFKDVSASGRTGHVGRTVSDQFKDVSATGPSGQLQDPPTLPHGLAQSSLADYSKEWSKYIAFAARTGDVIPGRDVEWDLDLVWEYLQFRARTCKPETIKQVLTKLGHFGARHKFIFATSKFDGDAYAYRSVGKMKKQLAINARDAAKDAGVAYEPVDRCTPVGKKAVVSMMLSGFALTSEERFNALSREDRHHVAGSVMQHTRAG